MKIWDVILTMHHPFMGIPSLGPQPYDPHTQWDLRVTKDVIFLVLLVSWMGVCADDGFEVIEFFAGVARIATLAKLAGFKSCAYDRDFGKASKMRGKRSPMDLNSNAGLVFLGWIL